ncbi:cell division protein FtsX [Krasilnikovia sp. MM14-A1259]|uniref:cell division protein FtsX n=1 Tax=Krasilnikovia sp. MM14-A1259 TaxID=3373539 RepID=UPI003830F239
MRALMIIVVSVLATMGVAACNPFVESDKSRIEREIDENARFTVYLRTNSTEQQKTDVQARLQALPGVTSTQFESRAELYERVKQHYADERTPMPAGLDPEHLPEDFEVAVRDQATIRQLRDSPVAEELRKLPGVQDVRFYCTTVEECGRDLDQMRSKAPR